MNNPFTQPWFSLWSETAPSWANQAFAPNTPPSMEAMWKQLSSTWQDMLGQAQARATMSQAEQMAQQAMSQMQRLFEQLGGQTSSTEAANAWRSLFERAGNQNVLWEMLPGYWRQQHQQLQKQQQWLESQMAPWLSQWQQQWDVPALGLYREHQEQLVALMQSHVNMQEKSKLFQQVMQQATEQAFAMFEDQLAAHAEPGRQLSSLRAVYDLWIDSAEEAFADVASSKEYQEAYGGMVDAQMQAKQQLQKQVSQWASSLGMPTRDEVDSTHKRVHELMRQMHAMSKEIASLKKQLADQSNDDKVSTRVIASAASQAKETVRTPAVKATKTVKKASKKVAKKPVAKKVVSKKAVTKKPVTKKVAKKAANKVVKKAVKKVITKTPKPAAKTAAKKVAKKVAAKAVKKSATATVKKVAKKAVKKAAASKAVSKKVAAKSVKKNKPKATAKAVRKLASKTAKKTVARKSAAKKSTRKAALKTSPKPAI